MELSLLLMKQILSMVLMILMGFTIVKTGILKSKQSSVLSALSLYLICPCTIVSAFQVEFTSDKLEGLMIATAASVVLHFVFILVTKVTGGLFHLTPVERASLIYSNGANLIIPLVSSLLGPEKVFYTSAFIAVQTVFLWTHCITLVNKTQKMSLKKILQNPNMLAIVVGVFLFLTQTGLPPIVDTTVANVGSIIGPVCMFMIGMVMGGVDFRQVFGKARLYLVCLGRLIVYPLLMVLLIRLTGITCRSNLAREVLMIVMLATCAPVAVIITQFANLWGQGDDPKDAGSINVMSVLFCIVTMPFIIWVYQLVC